MDIPWLIGGVIAAVLLIIRLLQYAKRIRTYMKRLKVAEKEIAAENAEILQMSIPEAKAPGMQVVKESATVESWTGPVPARVNVVLQKLDASVQDFFRTYRRCVFPETEFDADFLCCKPSSALEGTYQIGRDKCAKSIRHTLVVRPGSPVVLELNPDDRIIGEYPSIYHYFLLAEGE